MNRSARTPNSAEKALNTPRYSGEEGLGWESRSRMKIGQTWNGKHPDAQRGMALVLVLGMLVLMLGLTLAYFSRTALQRQISSSSAANAQVEIFARTGTECVIGDLMQEISAGSDPDPLAGNASITVPVKNPIWVTGTDGQRTAPSMAPQRVATDGALNVVKKSRSGTAFFQSQPGYQADVPASLRVSAIATSQPSANGHHLSKNRWNRPQLMTATELANFREPDWIYVNRSGGNPLTFTAADLKIYSQTRADNAECVIGRFAYVVYDVGGLIDINVAGNGLATADNARKGRLHQTSLAGGIGGVTLPAFANFVQWRWPDSHDDASAENGGLFDPQRTFLEVKAGEQAFVNRQDLINYAAQSGSALPSAALPYLTTFSRDVNAPLVAPDPTRPKLPASPDPDQLNPALTSVRFLQDVVLARPEGGVTVKAGTPVMPRRFPLAKLSMFAEADPDAAAMRYYFGLEKVNNNRWKYVATTSDGRIARLSEVAAAGREPNFFEILQAVILTGSLGKSGGDTATLDNARDSLRNLQVLQIGANIIDQWDGNDIPTTVEFPSGDPASPLTVSGIENLPYINQIAVIPTRPKHDRDLTQVWMLFDVWNPHQNATQAPTGITQYRIRPTSGRARVDTWYDVQVRGGDTPAGLKRTMSSAYENIIDLNDVETFTFPIVPPSGNYAEPTVIGDGEPITDDLRPGLLVARLPRAAVIPAKAERDEELQLALNAFMFDIKPYVSSSSTFTTNVRGERVYAPDVTFSGLNPDYWTLEKASPASQAIVYANYGVKAANGLQLRASEPFALELQLRTDGGEWITYQRVENLMRKGSAADERLSYSHSREYVEQADIGNLPAIVLQHTHHSMLPDESLTKCFYRWRTSDVRHASDTSWGFSRMDPRTHRFGFSTTDNDVLGFSPRTVNLPWTGQTASNLKNDTRWLRYQARLPGHGGTLGFEFWKANELPAFGLITNTPDLGAGQLNGSHPARYSDTDGIIRPGDGYFGSLPTLPARFADRPLLLNRPFRSVGELGYVFRDTPWKTLDFASRFSGDAGLLDVFTLDEPTDSSAVVAGKVNLNTRQPAALEAILKGAAKQPDGTAAAASTLTDAEATAIANAITTAAASAPFTTRGDLISRVLHKTGSPISATVTKVQREAAIRALSETSTTRTWNFLIDIVAQTGRFSQNASTGADFIVRAECRKWVHVAIDRITGQVVETRTETVHE